MGTAHPTVIAFPRKGEVSPIYVGWAVPNITLKAKDSVGGDYPPYSYRFPPEGRSIWIQNFGFQQNVIAQMLC